MSYNYGWQPYESVGCQPTPECLTVELDGITFTGRAPRGAGYGLTGWDGWDTGTETRGGEQEYGTADGGYETPVYLGSREITLEGRIVARSMAERNRMRGELGRILSVDRRAPMVVAEDYEGLERQADVRRVGRVKLTNDTPTTAIFTLQLKAAEWRRVDATQSTVNLALGEAVDLQNAGDVPADLSATFVGPLVNPGLTVDGVVWRYLGTIPAGETRQVEFADRRIWDPVSTKRYRLNAGGQWPAVQPGVNRAVLTGWSGSGSVELRWRSSWA